MIFLKRFLRNKDLILYFYFLNNILKIFLRIKCKNNKLYLFDKFLRTALPIMSMIRKRIRHNLFKVNLLKLLIYFIRNQGIEIEIGRS